MKNSARFLFLIGAALLLFSGQMSFAAPESGQVTVAVGEVKALVVDGEPAVEVKKGDTVAAGTTIITGPGSRAVVVITPKSAIRIAENSEVLIETIDEEASPSDVLINIKEGSLGALLKPNAASELDFKVKTPTGVAAARGTFYSVAVKDGKGYAQVKEGKVEIIPGASDAAGAQ